MTKQIGLSAKNNYLSVRFTLQPGTAFQNPCIMKLMIKTRSVYPFYTNNGVTSCTPCRQKIIESELRLKPNDLQPLRQSPTTLTEILAQRLHTRRSPGLV